MLLGIYLNSAKHVLFKIQCYNMQLYATSCCMQCTVITILRHSYCSTKENCILTRCSPAIDKLQSLLCLLAWYTLLCFQVVEGFDLASVSGTEEADGGGASSGGMVQTALDTTQSVRLEQFGLSKSRVQCRHATNPHGMHSQNVLFSCVLQWQAYFRHHYCIWYDCCRCQCSKRTMLLVVIFMS